MTQYFFNLNFLDLNFGTNFLDPKFFVTHIFPNPKFFSFLRVTPTDSGMGGDLSPPIGGGHMGGDKGPMGGDLRVIRDKIWRVLK